MAEKLSYVGIGSVFKGSGYLSKLGGKAARIFSWGEDLEKECFLLSTLCQTLGKRAFSRALESAWIQQEQSPYDSWNENKNLLSEIEIVSEKEGELLLFLQNRWLAKSSGIFSSVIHWVCPCFRISFQVHPETGESYGRSPQIKISPAYQKRIDAWKKKLPHPFSYPLVLTRPPDLFRYLPKHVEVLENERVEQTIEKISSALDPKDKKLVVDLTNAIPIKQISSKEWLFIWNRYQKSFLNQCKKNGIDAHRLCCIQRVQHAQAGGMRILPLRGVTQEEVEASQSFLLEWVSVLGLSTNRVELVSNCKNS